MLTIQCQGKVIAAKTATFKDDYGLDVQYGKIQLLCPDASGQFYVIQNIKVKSELFSALPDIANLIGKEVILDLTQQQFKNKVSYYLANPINKAQLASVHQAKAV